MDWVWAVSVHAIGSKSARRRLFMVGYGFYTMRASSKHRASKTPNQRLGVRSFVLVRTAHGGDSLIGRVVGQKRLGLPPVSVAVRHHDVEAPVTTFFLRLDEVESAEIEKIFFDESDFILRHAATLQVNRDAGQV